MALKYVDDVPAARPAADRLAQARAALAEAEDRKEVRPLAQITPNKPLSEAPDEGARRSGPGGFDRAAYHKSYMKDYMRGWRARKKGKAG
jgi:hypothetical protein